MKLMMDKHGTLLSLLLRLLSLRDLLYDIPRRGFEFLDGCDAVVVPMVGSIQCSAARAFDIVKDDGIVVQMGFEHNIRYKAQSVPGGSQAEGCAELVKLIVNIRRKIASSKCALCVLMHTVSVLK